MFEYNSLRSSQKVAQQQVELIPKAPAIAHIKKIEQMHKEKVMMYKTYALTLKDRYQKFESESQRHYANIIKKQQKVTDDMLKKKEDMLTELEQANKKAQDDLKEMKEKM